MFTVLLSYMFKGSSSSSIHIFFSFGNSLFLSSLDGCEVPGAIYIFQSRVYIKYSCTPAVSALRI